MGVGVVVLEADTVQRGRRRPNGWARRVSGMETRRGVRSWAGCLVGLLRERRRGAQAQAGGEGWPAGVQAEGDGPAGGAGHGQKHANQAGRKGRKGNSFSFSNFFQSNFKVNFECKFNSTWNLISNQAIQKDMQQHGCTHMIVNLH